MKRAGVLSLATGARLQSSIKEQQAIIDAQEQHIDRLEDALANLREPCVNQEDQPTADAHSMEELEARVVGLEVRLEQLLRSASFNGPRQVIEYLGRYSHRVAISNHRIKQVASDQVSFSYKDYRDESEKILRLTPMEFVRRFLQHVLPKGFAKIWHFGILSNRVKGQYITDILHFYERRQARS